MHSFTDMPFKNLYAYKDFHTLAYISVIKTFVTDLVLKNKNAISFLFVKTLKLFP